MEQTYREEEPCTMIRLTGQGRTAFESYRAKMREALSGLPGA